MMIPIPDFRSVTAAKPSGRAMGLCAFVAIMVLAFVALPAAGLAGDTRTGNDVKIGSGERLSENLYVAAGSFDFDGQIDGDINVSAGQATIGGTVDGSLHLFTGRSDLEGSVTGSVYIMSGRVRISGPVSSDVVVLGGDLELSSSGRIGGNLMVAGGQIDLRGTVEGDVTGTSGRTTLGGTNNGSVDLNTGDLSILDSARINGHVTYTSRNDADVSGNARIAQGITHEDSNPWGSGDHVLGRASGSLLRTLWALVAGAVLIGLAPRLANRIGGNGKAFLSSLLHGIVGMVVVPIAALVLLITVIGIPAGVLVLVGYLAVLYLSQVFAGMALGRFLLPGKWNDGSRGFHLLAMAIGVILIGATRFIPVPYIGGLIMLLVTLWGVGAAVMMVSPLQRETDPGLI
jgi:cytoskeletal protein CcmA (bactofilin family)